MSELSREDIRHLSHLARLELSEEEYERYAGQLTAVSGYVEQLQSVATEKLAATRGMTGMENVFAEDVYRSQIDPCSVDAMALINAAPLQEDRFVEVRAVLDEGEAS